MNVEGWRKKELTRLRDAVVLAALLAVAFGTARATRAQGASAAKSGAPPIKTLREALDLTKWDSAHFGPLLAVDPGKVKQSEPTAGADPSSSASSMLYQPPNGGLRIDTVAPHFDRIVVRVGSVTILAPKRMKVILSHNLPKPDAANLLKRSDLRRQFLASLAPAQWREITDAGGIGMSDLTVAQQILFRALVPASLRRTPVQASGSSFFGAPTDIPMNDAQRSETRVRINRSVDMALARPAEGGRNKAGVTVDPFGAGADAFFPNFQTQNRIGEVYGTAIVLDEPNRPKNGQLDFASAALDPAISLSRITTIGEAIASIRAATRVPLYVDGRAAPLSLFDVGHGTSRKVRSGDLLQALSRAVTGTYRKIGPTAKGKYAFVLTDDIEGISERLLRISTWYKANGALLSRLEDGMDKRIVAANAEKYLRYGSDDRFTAPESARSKLDAGRDAEVSLSSLTTSQQALAREAFDRAASLSKKLGVDNTEIADRVILSNNVTLTLRIPGLGDVPLAAEGPDRQNDTLLPHPPGKPSAPTTGPVRLPAALTDGGRLLVTPRSADDARSACAAAKRYGLRAVWVLLPPNVADDGLLLLTACIQAGKEAGMPIFAVDDPVHLPPGLIGHPPIDADLDRNILGNTHDGWLSPSSGDVIRSARTRATRLAAASGLAGIVLRELFTTGYGAPSEGTYDAYEAPDEDTLGYTVENRVDFLMKSGYDPIDLPGFLLNDIDYITFLPFFEFDNTLPTPPILASVKWRVYRHEQTVRFQADIVRSIHQVRPEIPVVVEDVRSVPAVNEWYSPWSVPGNKAAAPVRAGVSRVVALPNIHHTYRIGWNSSDVAKAVDGFDESASVPGMPLLYSHHVRDCIDEISPLDDGIDGVVFDLSALTVHEALTLLEAALVKRNSGDESHRRSAPAPPLPTTIRGGDASTAVPSR